MSKRRVANILIAKGKRCFRAGGRIPIVTVLSGTGTVGAAGIFTIVASDVATRAYLTVAATTNIGTLVGTAAVTG